MATANFVLFDLIVGDRVLNAAAISAILELNPAGLSGAALASALAAPPAIGSTTPSTGAFAGLTNTGTTITAAQTVAAAGATQGNAGAIGETITDVVVTVTASTQGVRLPAAVLNKRINVWPDPAVGVKLYPATGALIGAASTNAALAVVKNKPVQLLAVSTTKWRVMAGA